MTWWVDGRTFARKVRNPTYGTLGSNGMTRGLECPSCGFLLDNCDTVPRWPGLPAGVKFDPSDQELLEHLAAKVGSNEVKLHPFIDEFIPTLNEEDGICYTHPEKLPGVRNDGSSIHFFHRPTKAYNKGTRKRRKVQSGEDSVNGIEMRWHKTGKTRPVVENGRQIGCKKIMVLYVTSAKKVKADKTNWVMHQYHLGVQEDEKEGEYVVSKIFYQTQPRQCGLGLGHKEGGDNFEHVNPEITEMQAHSYHNSSPRTVINSNNSPEVPPPQTPRYVPKQPVKGLLASITEDVEKLQSSLAFCYDSVDSSCRSFNKVKGFIGYTPECSPELQEGNEYWWNNFGGNEKATGQRTDVPVVSVVDQRIDMPKSTSRQMTDTVDPEVINFLSSENVAMANNQNLCLNIHNRDSKDAQSKEVVLKPDSALENIILDTPPDFIFESLLNSQESVDWLGKKKFWSDSSQKTDDGSLLDFFRDSQSGV
ncbi:hypothetical protein KP509_23G050500 [Ceratopteris richardii]|nr:hypothetical protein KP509_23G050500 [Ceratopteris richardii]KAH7301966.1 hypothetical protein KP509_23G050500 [Ceratopteris richardii]